MFSGKTRPNMRIGHRGGVLMTGLWVGLSPAVGLSAQQAEVPIDYDAAIAQSGIDGSYGYFRALDGSATLIQSDTGERVRVTVNEPILVGDRVFVSGGSRAELVLADRNLLRIGDEAELSFRALANSGDSNDPASVLELARGTLQLVIAQDQLGQDYPTVVTPNATVVAQTYGSLLIVVDDDRRTEVAVRQGRVEVHTEAEAAEVREGESLFVGGARGENMEFAAAPSLDRLERWGNDLLDYDRGEYAEYVDSDLQYGASSLDDNGSWVDSGGGYAWRPHVSVGWAPYQNGRWRHTPSGMFWVSYEPWGWTPYHYGYWDLHLSLGWLWYPGHRFASAHVYWYWGPSYAGWIPSGYYWRHYGNHYGNRFGYYYGVYGHVGGGFGPYRHWTFLPHDRLGHRRQHFYSVNGRDLGRRQSSLERGVLFTDTRSLRPDSWRRPDQTLSRLRRAGSRDGRVLSDASSFVERSPRLTQEIERVTLTGRDGRSAGGAVRAERSDVSAQRPDVTTRGLEGRTQPLDRSGLQRGATGRDARTQSDLGVVGRTGSALRRPTSRSTPTGVQQPSRRPQVEGGRDVTRPTVRTPVTRDGSSRTLRRPDQPVTRGSSSRPAAQDRTRQPTVRRSGDETASPTARPTPSSSSRPTLRSGGASSRPTARPAPSSSSRPILRSGGTSSRPMARPAPSSSSRPTLRSGGTSSRPMARPAPSRSSRPSVRSGGSSRPAAMSAPSRGPTRSGARPSGGSRSQPSASRGGGGSRSAPRASTRSSGRSGGGARSSGSARSRGRSGG